MSEYQFVEKPLLNQLESMGWQVIEQGSGIPQNPGVSLRNNFREVLLKCDFFESVKSINRTESGEPWLTENQLEALFNDFSRFDTSDLLAANETFLERLYKWQLDRNELTGEVDPTVKIIDFDNWQNNRFLAINQFRIDTPGGVKDFIIPDVVLFVNGLPLVVIECKDVNSFTSDAMSEAIKQLQRYADLREDTIAAGLSEGEQKLFWTNQLMIATHGDNAKFGTITSTEEYYFNWKTIHPDTTPYMDGNLHVHRPQEQLVQGMLHPARLLEITRSFTLIMDAGKQRIKVVCRYQQYRAVQKTIAGMLSGNTGLDRSGVIWHTQGSGKSLTMVFLVRQLRRDPVLKEYKVLMVNDRKDLDKQLGETAALTGDTVQFIGSVSAAKTGLADDSSTTNMVMIHKFREEDDSNTPEYFKNVLSDDRGGYYQPKEEHTQQHEYHSRAAAPPVYEAFGTINGSEKVLILIDEAHRTQRSGRDRASLSDNLFDAFPNATRIAFTGTPLIADHHTDPTWKRFGNDPNKPYIDTYKLQDAVEDGATLQILYEGKTADTAIYDKHGFDTKFENLFKERSEEELRAIRKKYGATGDILEAEARIEEIAQDLVSHYISNILPSGFKAQVVCSSKQAAIHYQTYIRKALESWITAEEEKPADSQDANLLARVRFLKAAVVISSDGTNEKAVFVAARKEARALDAVKSFKNKFDTEKPETGVAFLIVCDMLLTGFDAPIEQVMYIDKKLKEHNLLQTIARVNRTYPNKTVGYVVDYIGLTENLKTALSLYSGDDQADILDSFKSIESEVPVLESRYQRLIQLFEDKGVSNIEALVTQKLGSDAERFQVIEKAVQILEDIKTRDSFNVYLKKFMQSMDIILPNRLADRFKIPMYQFAHLQAKARERYKDDSINVSGAGEKVRKLVNEHLLSLGINPKVPPVELFSPHFVQQVKQQQDPRAAASEMEHAIRKHCKVHEGEDPVMYKRFSEKLENVLKKYNETWDQLVLALEELRVEIDRGRAKEEGDLGPFYDLIVDIAFAGTVSESQQKSILALVDDIIRVLSEEIRTLNFWQRPAQVSALEGKLEEAFILSGIDELASCQEQLVTDVVALAKRREQSLLNGSHKRDDEGDA
ncbi:HsdR family type I site-specific deoxyribonuclease [Aurantivibrio plasticivorans]